VRLGGQANTQNPAQQFFLQSTARMALSYTIRGSRVQLMFDLGASTVACGPVRLYNAK
jgi:hypothetical protein